MLKDFQLAINRDTKSVDAAAKKPAGAIDKPKLAALVRGSAISVDCSIR